MTTEQTTRGSTEEVPHRMRVLLIHNDYGGYSGEEFIFDRVRSLLLDRGHEVAEYRRSSQEIERMPLGRARAFLLGIHSPSACRDIRRLLRSFRPDVVHVQNVFPLISPSILGVCQSMGVPVVMNVQNFRLACPNGLLFSHGEICHRCVPGKEYWCVLRNCEGNLLKSIGYATRNAVARARGSFFSNINAYMAPTAFHREWLMSLGVHESRIHVVPNMVDAITESAGTAPGDFVGFAGRVSPEKGVPVLLEAARRLPAIPFQIAGNYDRQPDLITQAPANVRFLGALSGQSLTDFYEQMRMLVVPSVWYEGLPTVIPQAMLRGKPVIASRIGGLSYVVQDGVTGRLFRMGDAEDLASCVQALWADQEAHTRMGRAAREEAAHQYSLDRYYHRLKNVFTSAISRPLHSRTP
jgi:glycosyltransferase involved in cell wall biosynthesis